MRQKLEIEKLGNIGGAPISQFLNFQFLKSLGNIDSQCVQQALRH
jgi:hypothetical protein